MNLWTPVHWSEGMFLRPQHLQTAQRWMETMVASGFSAARSYPWGFLDLQIASAQLENFTVRLDACTARLKDGTWVRIPENTQVEPLSIEKTLPASGTLDIFFGIPQLQEVRANSVSLEDPSASEGIPRFEPHGVMRRDENTGANPQMLYTRRMRGRLFAAGEDMTGFEVLRVGAVKRTDRPGALPELDVAGAGPLLSIQGNSAIFSLVSSMSGEVEAKCQRLAGEAREHKMLWTDGVPANLEHLVKLHTLNDPHAQLKALLQAPMLHPFDVYCVFSRIIGCLSVFHEDLAPTGIPKYDHDRLGQTFDALRRRLTIMLESFIPTRYAMRPFSRKKDSLNLDGLEVELDRSWIDENLELYVALQAESMDEQALQQFIYTNLNMKMASPTKAPKISTMAVRGLRLQAKPPPAGTLPRRPGLHYFKIDKTIGADRTDYWKECEQERAIRIGIKDGQLKEFEKFAPTLYIPLKERS